MCGIAGIVTKEGMRPSPQKIKAMAAALAHRGPDDEGFYLKNNVALGHRRLSILDLSSAGHQPMESHDGTLKIIFNGEIYNYLELKKELGPRNYKSNTDTEVLLLAYQKWGPAFLKKLNGIFAFAIWDEKKKILFCARDHVGVKPFYYTFQNGVFYFGSEIKALLAAGIKACPNGHAIYDYLTYGYYHHLPETFFKDIYQLPAGHALFLKGGELSLEKYWDLAERAKESSAGMIGWSDKKVADEFFKILENAVRSQLRSDVPISIQLSGGLDSSMVAAMANKIVRGQRNFRLFSFVYGNYRDKETPYIKALAKGLGWNVDFIKILPNDMRNLMNEVTWHQEEPFPGLPTFGQHMLCKASRAENIPVTLGGQGGDEIGGGYEYYMGAFLLDAVRAKGASYAFGELMDYGVRHNVSSVDANLKFFLNSLNAYFLGGASADATSFVRPGVFRPGFAKAFREAPHPAFAAPLDSHFSNMQYRDITRAKLPRILQSSDRSSMAYGVEHRVPLLDHRLVEFGVALAPWFSVRNGEQRFFMRQALKTILPKRVASAPKRAVPSPQREWFKGELQPWIWSILKSKSFGKREYFDQEKVLEEYKKYCQTPGVPANSFHIWQWIHLETWLRTFFD